ncbi:uncharacterized protein [Dermacentor albipictus]|uniref:uncharacterized protein isoform X1 n=1 Tax=Dermacentor albipictus TaxID=60249 RepID=UPI0031FC06E2
MQRTWNESSLRRSLPRRNRRRSRRLCSSVEVQLPLDSSGPESVARYVLFVLFAAATVIVVVAPGALLLRTRPCRNLSGCYSLQRDLLASIDNRVPPCDDFYWHVCSGWDRQYATTRGQTASWYEEVFMDVFLWKIMQRIVPKTPVKTLDKAASMLLHCVKDSGHHGGEALRHFLQEVGLSWPHRSPATREQLLDSLVVLSLDIGMPTLLKFVVGRHLSRPTENTLYMSLDRRYELWSQDIDRLHGRGALSRYLRRGAEVVGGLGGSYSIMIEDVLTTHEDLWTFVQHSYNTYTAPRYVNLSDPELRRAINGHLPDDSQLWADDEVVDLHPGIFDSIDESYLRVDGHRERFKLFLGAYLVWTLSPFLSSHLHKAMLADMGRVDSALARRSRQCFETISHVMPLASWTLQADLVGDTRFAWSVVGFILRALNHYVTSYSQSAGAAVASTTAYMKINALNMSSTWPMLDKVYAFVPGETINGSYFDRYRRVAHAAVLRNKQSLRSPRQNIYHLPGVSHEIVYRLLVAREVPVSYASLSPPLSVPGHALAVPLATVGIPATNHVLALLYMDLYSDHHFQPHSEEKMKQILGLPLYNDMTNFGESLKIRVNGTAEAQTLTLQERYDIMKSSIATLAAVHVIEKHYTELAKAVWLPAATSFPGIPDSKLLFLLTCFMNCGSTGRLHFLKRTYCNIALPAVPSFLRVFHCPPGSRLVTNFKWRSPME